jgi:hypothetical protein
MNSLPYQRNKLIVALGLTNHSGKLSRKIQLDQSVEICMEVSFHGLMKSGVDIVLGYKINEINNIVSKFHQDNFHKKNHTDSFNLTYFNNIRNVAVGFNITDPKEINLELDSNEEIDKFFQKINDIFDRLYVLPPKEGIYEYLNCVKSLAYHHHIYTVPIFYKSVNNNVLLSKYLEFVASNIWPEDYDAFLKYIDGVELPNFEQ